jgi:isopenicillin N synthase-like dioxygenase
MIDDGLPVIDLSSVSSPEDRKAIGKQLVASVETIGFFYVVGHSIDPTLTKNAFDSSREFFSLTEDQKQTVAVNQAQRGWMRKGLTRLEGSASADVKEVFFLGARSLRE